MIIAGRWILQRVLQYRSNFYGTLTNINWVLRNIRMSYFNLTGISILYLDQLIFEMRLSSPITSCLSSAGNLLTMVRRSPPPYPPTITSSLWSDKHFFFAYSSGSTAKNCLFFQVTVSYIQCIVPIIPVFVNQVHVKNRM